MAERGVQGRKATERESEPELDRNIDERKKKRREEKGKRGSE